MNAIKVCGGVEVRRYAFLNSAVVGGRSQLQATAALPPEGDFAESFELVAVWAPRVDFVALERG